MNYLPEVKFYYTEEGFLKSIFIEFPEIFIYSNRLMEIFKKDYLKTVNSDKFYSFNDIEIIQKIIVDSFASFEGIMEELLKKYLKKIYNKISENIHDFKNLYTLKKDKKFYKNFNLWHSTSNKKLDISCTYKNIFEKIDLIRYFTKKNEKNNVLKKRIEKFWEEASAPPIIKIQEDSEKYFEEIVKKLYEKRNKMVHTSEYKEKEKIEEFFDKDVNHLNLMLIFLFFILSVEYTLQEIFYPNDEEFLDKNNIKKCNWEINSFSNFLKKTEEENKFDIFENFFQ